MEETAAGFVMKHRSRSVIQRAASVKEVANLFGYAASPQASATPGAAFRVNGAVVFLCATDVSGCQLQHTFSSHGRHAPCLGCGVTIHYRCIPLRPQRSMGGKALTAR